MIPVQIVLKLCNWEYLGVYDMFQKTILVYFFTLIWFENFEKTFLKYKFILLI